MERKLLSVVIPMYCEQETVGPLYERLAAVLDGLDMAAEVIFVDDGSEDGTARALRRLARRDARVTAIELARNFGLNAAVTAGLDRANGDAVVLMDGDLQDPPELIPELIAKWREGYHVVNAVKDRRPERLPRRLAFRAFYGVFRALAELDLPVGCGLFSLMDRRVVRELRLLRERSRFVPGMRWWVGFRQCCVPFDRERRHAGRPRQTPGKLVRLATDAVFSFSSRPLTLALWLGLATALLSFGGIAAICYIKLFTDAAIPGWASNMVTTLFMGAVQLIVIGIVGQYIARIYEEVKRRPLYVVRSVTTGSQDGIDDERGGDRDPQAARGPALVVRGAQAGDPGAGAAVRREP